MVKVALCTKTYVLRDREGVETTALKGMNKKFVSQSSDKCKQVLTCGQSLSSTSKRFRVPYSLTSKKKWDFLTFIAKES